MRNAIRLVPLLSSLAFGAACAPTLDRVSRPAASPEVPAPGTSPAPTAAPEATSGEVAPPQATPVRPAIEPHRAAAADLPLLPVLVPRGPFESRAVVGEEIEGFEPAPAEEGRTAGRRPGERIVHVDLAGVPEARLILRTPEGGWAFRDADTGVSSTTVLRSAPGWIEPEPGRRWLRIDLDTAVAVDTCRCAYARGVVLHDAWSLFCAVTDGDVAPRCLRSPITGAARGRWETVPSDLVSAAEWEATVEWPGDGSVVFRGLREPIGPRAAAGAELPPRWSEPWTAVFRFALPEARPAGDDR
jgi:hypothetical protein